MQNLTLMQRQCNYHLIYDHLIYIVLEVNTYEILIMVTVFLNY
jgi:hypothetical protein